jgi:hypothetical protein
MSRTIFELLVQYNNQANLQEAAGRDRYAELKLMSESHKHGLADKTWRVGDHSVIRPWLLHARRGAGLGRGQKENFPAK